VRVMGLLILGIVLGGFSAAPAGAQFDDRPHQFTNLSCQNWNAEVRNSNPQLMQQLSGVWRTQNVMPAVPGVSAAVPETITMTRYSNGSLTYEKDACFPGPPPPPGLPPLQGRCAKAIGHGGWFARPGQNGWISVGIFMQGSGYTGEPNAPSCTLVQVRFIDANTIVNQFNARGQRIGTAQ
jgi:hypothetical protein